MGRSVPTYRNHLEQTINRWNRQYRARLHPLERPAWDRLMFNLRSHASAGHYALGTPDFMDPLEPMLLAVLLENEKRIRALEGH